MRVSNNNVFSVHPGTTLCPSNWTWQLQCCPKMQVHIMVAFDVAAWLWSTVQVKGKFYQSEREKKRSLLDWNAQGVRRAGDRHCSRLKPPVAALFPFTSQALGSQIQTKTRIPSCLTTVIETKNKRGGGFTLFQTNTRGRLTVAR